MIMWTQFIMRIMSDGGIPGPRAARLASARGSWPRSASWSSNSTMIPRISLSVAVKCKLKFISPEFYHKKSLNQLLQIYCLIKFYFQQITDKFSI